MQDGPHTIKAMGSASPKRISITSTKIHDYPACILCVVCHLSQCCVCAMSSLTVLCVCHVIFHCALCACWRPTLTDTFVDGLCAARTPGRITGPALPGLQALYTVNTHQLSQPQAEKHPTPWNLYNQLSWMRLADRFRGVQSVKTFKVNLNWKCVKWKRLLSGMSSTVSTGPPDFLCSSMPLCHTNMNLEYIMKTCEHFIPKSFSQNKP